METQMLDSRKAEAFGERMIEILNSGALSLMISIGHRTGLFDVMGELPASTSEVIAEKAGLQERYVREWLGAMVVSRVVDFDPAQGKYHLPYEHAACLTRKSTIDNIAVFAQYIPLLGTVEDRIVECFRKGGGVPYSEFGRFHAVMAEDSGQTVVAALLDHILPLVPGLSDRLRAGIDVLDIGCGSGLALNLLAEHFPNSRFIGYDISEEGIRFARRKASETGISNLKFALRDVSQSFETSSFDLITAFDAIHDQARPDRVLHNVAQSLRPDGVFLMQDIRSSSFVENNIDHPVGTLLYTISCMHCMTVSLAENGMGLGTMWGEELAVEMLRRAGFKKIRVEQLPHDFQNSYFIVTKT